MRIIYQINFITSSLNGVDNLISPDIMTQIKSALLKCMRMPTNISNMFTLFNAAVKFY